MQEFISRIKSVTIFDCHFMRAENYHSIIHLFQKLILMISNIEIMDSLGRQRFSESLRKFSGFTKFETIVSIKINKTYSEFERARRVFRIAIAFLFR